jgi:hypothetical protein
MAKATDQSTSSNTTTQTLGGATKPARRSIVLDLPANKAMALAQLVKRFGYDDAERMSARHSGGAEHEAMVNGVGKLQSALAGAGYAPRWEGATMPETPTTYMSAKEAAALADDLASYGGKRSVATRLTIMERQCRQASRLIRAMMRQTHSSDVWALPPEE